MRLAALALHAHAATSRFTTAPTARFSVVVARAMSELVGGGEEPTTTAEERAELERYADRVSALLEKIIV